MLAGWSSGSKYPLLGSVRASAQMVCYEAALGLSVVAVVLRVGLAVAPTTSCWSRPAAARATSSPTGTSSSPASCRSSSSSSPAPPSSNRPPFDLVEAEQELVGGFHTEYSSIRFALFYLAEFMNTITMSAIIVTLFLGGPGRPVAVRARLDLGARCGSSPSCSSSCSCSSGSGPRCPRFRYDQLMDLGWKLLIPLVARLAAAARRACSIGRRRGLEPGRGRAGRPSCVLARRRRAAVDGRCASARRAPSSRRRCSLMGYLDGFRVTFGKLFKSTATGEHVTVEYPKEKRPKPERLHGRHVLNRYEDGMEKCIGCELCAGVCPARCIYVRGADNPPDDPVSPGERYGFVYEINYLRCIHCDLCVEACPTEAITESKLFEFSLHQPRRTPSTRRPSCWSTTTAGRSSCRGRTGATSTRSPPTPRPGCGPPPPSGSAAYEGAVGVVRRARLRRAGRPSAARPPSADGGRRRRRPDDDAPTATTTTTTAEGTTDGRARRLRRRRRPSCLAGARRRGRSPRNPVHAALSLVATLFGIAVLFVAQEAHFLAAVQVIVYAGAIVVLFLFVIMLLGVDQAEDLAIEPLGGPADRARSSVGLGRPRRCRCSPCSSPGRQRHGGHRPPSRSAATAVERRPPTSTSSASRSSPTTCSPSRSPRCCW